MRNRIMELEAEKKNLNLTKQVCQKAIDQHLDMERLDSLSINEKAEVWQRKLAVIMKEDTVKIPLTKKEFNFHIAIMMAWGYFLCAVFSFLSQAVMLDTVDLTNRVVSTVAVIILIICYFLGAFTSKMFIQLAVFHVAVIAQSIFAVLYFSSFPRLSVYSKGIPYIWIGLGVFSLLIYFIQKSKPVIIQKIPYLFITLICYLVVFGVVMNLIGPAIFHQKELVLPVFVITLLEGVIGACIGLQWAHAVRDCKSYNRYYALHVSGKMMNLIGSLASGIGYYSPGNIRR